MTQAPGSSDYSSFTDCSEISLRVYEYIDAELDPADVRRFEVHLSECPDCLDEYQQDLVLKALVRRSCACESAPSTLRMQIMRSITTVSVDRRDRPTG